MNGELTVPSAWIVIRHLHNGNGPRRRVKARQSPGDWGVAMDNLERFILRLTTGTECHLVLIAHLKKRKDEISGGISLMASTLGAKARPKIPQKLRRVVLSSRQGEKFWWTTSAPTSILSRTSPFSDSIDPDFKEIILP